MRLAIRIALFILGIAGIGDTLFLSTRAHLTFGVIIPFVLGLPLLLIAIFYAPVLRFFASSAFGAVVKWVLISGYAAFALFVGVMSVIISSAADKKPDADCDAVIVLGAGIRGERVSLTLARRLDAAMDYAKNVNPRAFIVVSGGKSAGNAISEAEAMRRYLVAGGIAEERIIVEDKATSTYENFSLSLPLIKERAGDDAKIAFATTRFHVFRAEGVARSVGVSAQGIGAPGVWYITPNDYIREAFVIVYYHIIGKM